MFVTLNAGRALDVQLEVSRVEGLQLLWLAPCPASWRWRWITDQNISSIYIHLRCHARDFREIYNHLESRSIVHCGFVSPLSPVPLSPTLHLRIHSWSTPNCFANMDTRLVAMDDPVSLDSASSSATVASSQRSTSSYARRQLGARQHSYTHCFPAKSASEGPSERVAASKKNGTTSRAAMRELLHPTSSLDPDARSRLLCTGLQWLLESPESSHESNKCALRPLSHDAVDALNLERTTHPATTGRSNKATGSQSTKTWIDEQSKVTAEKPW